MGAPFNKAKGEREKKEISISQFSGVNVQAKRYSIKDTEFSWLENVMPVGDGNLQVCPIASAALSTLPGQTVSSSYAFNIMGTDYIAAFTSSGTLFVAPNPFSSFTQYGNVGQFSASGVTAAQWKNERLLIGDPANGYFSWDNNAGIISSGGVAYVAITAGGSGYSNSFSVTFTGGGGSGAQGTAIAVNGVVTSVTITNPGNNYTSAPTPVFSAGGGSSAAGTANLMAGPSKCTSIATFSGRVWVGYQRTISYTDISQANNFYSFAGGSSGSLTISDSTLHDYITSLIAANNFLYIFGDDSIDVIGDVQVVSGSTTFTRTNITASIGTNQMYSVFSYYRSLMFAGNVGFYSLPGAVPEKLSDNLDTFYAQINFATPISGGQVSVNNTLCAAFLCSFNDIFTGSNSSRNIIALYFNKKWWFSSQGPTINLIISATINGSPFLYGWAGGTLYQLFSNSSTSVNTRIQTKLYDGKAPVMDKASLKFGIGITFGTAGNQAINVTIDNEKTTMPVFTNLGNTLQWINNSGSNIYFTNNSGNPLTWITAGYAFDYRDAAISGGKYLGVTVYGNSLPYTVNQILIEYEEGARW